MLKIRVTQLLLSAREVGARAAGRLPDPKRDPINYVHTDWVSGLLQFELLRDLGLQPSHRVLEIGCGRLHAAVPIVRYLESGRYVGVDPNPWLREDVLRLRMVRRLMESRNACFVSDEHFDPGPVVREPFDFAFAHSVLSHTSHDQLWEFFRAIAPRLRPDGRILASIRLAEGNAHGSLGSPDGTDTRAAQWVYPGVTFYRAETVREAAEAAGLQVEIRPEYTAHIVARRPREVHDWIVAAPIK